MMDDHRKSFLVRAFGFSATLIHGDTLELDRWRWLIRHLPRTRNGERLLDVGCGSGAFTIGAALRGYKSVGLSWDERNQATATLRAEIVRAPEVKFPVIDARRLDEIESFSGQFDFVICLEVTEHIIDDLKLFRDIYSCLKPGGRLLLTTPNYNYVAISPTDNGPFETSETGWHVRRGYTPAMLRELCDMSGFTVEQIGYCSFFFSQMITRLLRSLQKRFGLAGWAAVLPLRVLPLALDRWLGRAFTRPGFSITLVAYKPRVFTRKLSSPDQRVDRDSVSDFHEQRVRSGLV
jgi:SAM-dependent methyltransferase